MPEEKSWRDGCSGLLGGTFPLGGRSLGGLGAVEEEHEDDADHSKDSHEKETPTARCQLPRHDEPPSSRKTAISRNANVATNPITTSPRLPVLPTAGFNTATPQATLLMS